MSADHTTPINVDVCVGELSWPKISDATQAARQQQHLMQITDSAEKGMILDCSLVEIGNSEIINVLMRVRNHAKKVEKEVVLFNVPQTLSDTIRLCNLLTILPVTEDALAAKRQVYVQASGKGKLRIWAEAHPILSAVIALSVFLVAVLAWWLLG